LIDQYNGIERRNELECRKNYLCKHGVNSLE
jgi:hypothetical protein